MLSISLSGCESNDSKAGFNKFVKEANDLYENISSDESLSLGDVEVRVSENFRSFEQKFLEMCVSQKAGEKESEPVVCPACQEPCRPLRMRERHFTTLCGKISVNRWVYCCEQGHRHAPWDAKQKLLDQYTHRVAEAMVLRGFGTLRMNTSRMLLRLWITCMRNLICPMLLKLPSVRQKQKS